MVDSSKLLELAERIEGLDGPNREIDRDIALAFAMYDRPEDLGCFHDPAKAVVSGGGQTWAPPAFTESIDVALWIVPTDWTWLVDATGYARLNHVYGQHENIDVHGVRTPALAICVAALRAHAAIEGKR